MKKSLGNKQGFNIQNNRKMGYCGPKGDEAGRTLGEAFPDSMAPPEQIDQRVRPGVVNQIDQNDQPAQAERIEASPNQGLTGEQAEQRMKAGLCNEIKDRLSKTEGQIVRDNVFTFFNLLFFLLALCLLAVGSYTDMLFFGIIIVNTLIGIVQELRVKRTLDKISLLAAKDVIAVRDGKQTALPPGRLVLDDIVLFGPGSQICADAILCEGSVEVNEALLTGEADTIVKKPGDTLLSGSFVTAGRCAARLDRVGEASYAAGIASQAKQRKKNRSEMMRSLDGILKWIGIGIVPVGLIMFAKQAAMPDTGAVYAVRSTVAAMVGMIPEGLYLLVSIALALGVIKLARSSTLVHELSCIENLARVDVLCLDKTGTITEGTMEVVETIPLGTLDEESFRSLTGAYVHASESDNVTARAMKEHFPRCESSNSGNQKRSALNDGALNDSAMSSGALNDGVLSDGEWRVEKEIPFSSERKWGALQVENRGTFILGAPEMILKERIGEYRGIIGAHLSAGRRVLLLAQSRERQGEARQNEAGQNEARQNDAGRNETQQNDARQNDAGQNEAGQNDARQNEVQQAETQQTGVETITPLGFVVLTDTIRSNACETLRYFREQGVTVKVISGDNAESVAAVAQRAGVENAAACIDMESMARSLEGLGPEEEAKRLRDAAEANTVFGRVSPQQKRALIRGLKENGHTVAMIGDGVNDVLALKEADCSIAMAAGSDAAQHVSQLVLLKSDFSVMPQIVKEGRRVINNIQRSSSLFLVKNMFSFITTMVLLFAAMPYPFVPIQLTLISGLLIGLPSFLLTLEPSYERIQGNFLRNIILNALPGGLVNGIGILAALWLGANMGLPMEEISSICTLITGVNGLLILLFLCWPLTLPRLLLVTAMGIGFFGGVTLLAPLFHITALSALGWQLFLTLAAAGPVLMGIAVFSVSRIKRRTEPRRKGKARQSGSEICGSAGA